MEENNETVNNEIVEETNDSNEIKEEISEVNKDVVEEKIKVNNEELKEQLREEIKEELVKKTKRRKVRKIFLKLFSLCFWLLVIVWVVIVGTDYLQVQKNAEPRFCLDKETKTFEKGTVNICNGLGYKFFKYKSDEVETVEFGPFWIEPNENNLKR